MVITTATIPPTPKSETMDGLNPDQDARTRQRIVDHMNKDHQDSLVRYVEHLHGLSSRQARNAKLLSVSPEGMWLSANHTPFLVKFNPPLKSWSEIRPRVIDMDSKAIATLGRSKATIRTFTGPANIIQWASLIGVIGLIITALRPSILLPGRPIYDNLFAPYKPLAGLGLDSYIAKAQTFIPKLVAGLLAVHLLETIVLHKQLLTKHSVPTFSALWWKWIIASFFEGISVRLRLKSMIGAEFERMKNAKH